MDKDDVKINAKVIELAHKIGDNFFQIELNTTPQRVHDVFMVNYQNYGLLRVLEDALEYVEAQGQSQPLSVALVTELKSNLVNILFLQHEFLVTKNAEDPIDPAMLEAVRSKLRTIPQRDLTLEARGAQRPSSGIDPAPGD